MLGKSYISSTYSYNRCSSNREGELQVQWWVASHAEFEILSVNTESNLEEKLDPLSRFYVCKRNRLDQNYGK